jgi:hypothetical protein
MAKKYDPRIYRALALPEQAIENGGLEILRVGIIDDDLYVTAIPAFQAPAQWGEVLADIARRVSAIYTTAGSGLTRKDAMVEIAEAFAAAMGARPVKAKRKALPAKKASARKKMPARRKKR